MPSLTTLMNTQSPSLRSFPSLPCLVAGHVYAIGDCGGAQEASRCPDCKSAIGGTNYRLQGGNTLATEMDGATQSAWPDQVV